MSIDFTHIMGQTRQIKGFPICLIIPYRHTFATLSLKNGAGVKTLSSALGLYSAGFTLNAYTCVTAQMKQNTTHTIGNVISQKM